MQINVSYTNVSFKHLCSPAAPITGPWNCVVYRDIRPLKAHSSSRRFSSNCVGNVAPKRFSGCGFVLTMIGHTSAQGPICAIRIVYMYIHGRLLLAYPDKTSQTITLYTAHYHKLHCRYGNIFLDNSQPFSNCRPDSGFPSVSMTGVNAAVATISCF